LKGTQAVKKTDTEPEKVALNIASFCARYSVARTRVFNEIKAGRLAARKVGRNVSISVEEGDRWYESLPLRKAS
jgi:hypothetical protein